MLAALLHGPAIASDLQNDFNSFALPETVATSVLQLVASAALGLGLWLLAGLLLARRRSTASPVRDVPGSSSRRAVWPPAVPYGISLRARLRFRS